MYQLSKLELYCSANTVVGMEKMKANRFNFDLGSPSNGSFPTLIKLDYVFFCEKLIVHYKDDASFTIFPFNCPLQFKIQIEMPLNLRFALTMLLIERFGTKFRSLFFYLQSCQCQFSKVFGQCFCFGVVIVKFCKSFVHFEISLQIKFSMRTFDLICNEGKL